jgi:hypothetical protein
MGKDIQTDKGVNTFFHFFEKNIPDTIGLLRKSHSTKKRRPADPVPMGIGGR